MSIQQPTLVAAAAQDLCRRLDTMNSAKPARHHSILFGFAPWIIFDVVAGPSTWKLAAFTALVASVLLNLGDLRQRSLKLLELAGIVFFAVITVLAVILDRGDMLWLETYAQPLSSGVVAVVALGSLAFTPFTEQYARDETPQAYWTSPKFRRINRVLTAAWGCAFLVIAILGLIAIHAPGHSDWYNWVLPIVLLVAAIKFTSWYPKHAAK
ncbi:hypothetical protein [Streptomyces cyaneofuscatus]|uniref:hypothetical protein n=1 Tax=Streptomyces cyaneofuscatus TaxID=66883 RepID=UPI00381F541F